MSTLMTATPISMNIMQGYSIFSTGIVIQFHVIGMFLPSLFTGNLIKKYGHKNIILTGIFILFICIFINFNFVTYYGFLLGLILLGVGWNFLFVSGTSLLVISYDEDNKFLSQGLNDFVVFSSQAIGSLSAGLLLYLTSWKTLNLICFPLLLLLIYFILRNNFKIIQNN
jgi:MFS family permease